MTCGSNILHGQKKIKKVGGMIYTDGTNITGLMSKDKGENPNK